MSGSGFAAQLAQDLDPDDVRTVLEVFRLDVGQLGDLLEHSVAAGDVTAFRRTCHALAGAAGAVGAKALEQACRRAMERGDLGRDGLTKAVAEVRKLTRAALVETTAFLATLPRSDG